MMFSILPIAVTLSMFNIAPEAGIHGHYAVLTAKVKTPPPFKVVDVIAGPSETINDVSCRWWQLEVIGSADESLFSLRLLASPDLLSTPEDVSSRIVRYQLRIPETGEALEYVNKHTMEALLPAWHDFQKYFIPHPAEGSGYQKGMPETATYLGHVLTLQYVGHNVPWDEWDDVIELQLDPELLVGTGRNFRDAEGHRLPQTPKRQNYTYVKFTKEEYAVMIEAGFNLFTISPDQEPYVRSQPVFYIRQVGGDPPIRYPADLYRSNYIGAVMFMDEPAIIMVGDENVHNTLRYFSDAAELLQKRIRERYNCGSNYSAFKMDRALREMGINLGDMVIEQWDYPAWGTIYETAYYQLRAGLAGIVHEGRYRLDPFDDAIARFTDERRRHTPEEMLEYHYAFLRGAARAFGGDWGMSIYGQCDPAISPLAIRMAYDCGARYIWFWTSDHDHHVPWNEQLELVRALRQHEKSHPRGSIRGRKPVIDRAIVIPYGYFLSLGNLWWVRALDKEGKNEASRRYETLMRWAIAEFHDAVNHGEEFDFIVDDGREIKGYKKVIKISDQEL